MIRPRVALGTVLVGIALAHIGAQAPEADADIRLNVIVSETGNLRNDGKGIYRTGEDYVAAWLNPTRWPDIAFDICMNWPFNRYPGRGSSQATEPSGTHDRRALVHRLVDPAEPGRQAIGVFTGPGGGNDIGLAKPLTPTVRALTDMAVGTSLSPVSAEVRFCNADCTAVYSLMFGERSVFGYPTLHGLGTTRPTVSRISETEWRIDFPPRSLGRLWDRTDPSSGGTKASATDLGLFYYEGRLDLKRQ